MTRLYVILCFVFSFSCSFVIAQEQEKESFQVVFWNTENLFDTQKDSLKQDDEFLPSSLRAWHYGRYKKKLADVSRVITALGKWNPPALVGLCEVENDKVMRDLAQYSSLKEHGYRYVMTDSPDERGIDVALLYQRDKFKLLCSRSLRIIPGKGRRPTRDILHVTGIIPTLDTLDVFVAHFPSRSSGEKETEPYRLQAASLLRSAVDSLFSTRLHPQIIIMGDLNDYPYNKSVSKVLHAGIPDEEPDSKTLYHLLARKESGKGRNRSYGSHKYKGEWGLLDHMIVSGNLLDRSSSFFTSEEKAGVARLSFMLIEDDKYGGLQPFRTYNGMKYQGGYSDHLPVYAEFEY